MKHIKKREVLGLSSGAIGLLLLAPLAGTMPGADGVVRVQTGTFANDIGAGNEAMRALSQALSHNAGARGARADYVSLGNAKGPLRCFVSYDRASRTMRVRDTTSGMEQELVYAGTPESAINAVAARGGPPFAVARYGGPTREPSPDGGPSLLTRLKLWALR